MISFNAILQENMIEFRRKLIVILLDSELNKIKGKPIYYKPHDERIVSDSDCMIVEGSGRLNVPDGNEDKPPIPVQQLMPTDQRELVYQLCKYIMSIQDAKCLE